MREREYTVVFEQIHGGGWSAFVPDLPGLGVGADTREEAEKLIRDGVRVYIEELTALGEPIPEPSSFTTTVKIPVLNL